MSIVYNSLPEEIATKLSDLIFIERKYCPGDKIPTERELSAMFGVGRNTVREAVKMLVQGGVLSVERGRGTFVLEPSEASNGIFGLTHRRDKVSVLKDWTQIRIALEPLAVELAIMNGTENDFADIQRLNQEYQAKALAGESTEQIDRAFHIAIARASHNRILEKLTPMMESAIWDIVRWNLIMGTDNQRVSALDVVAYEHDLITKQILVKNTSAAVNLMRSHIQKVYLLLEDSEQKL